MVDDPRDMVRVELWTAILTAELNNVLAFLSFYLEDLGSDF